MKFKLVDSKNEPSDDQYKMASAISEIELFWMTESERQNPHLFPRLIFYEGNFETAKVMSDKKIKVFKIYYAIIKLYFLLNFLGLS